MGDMVQLTQVTVRKKVADPIHTEYTVTVDGPVWVHPMGVNVVGAHRGGAKATVLRTDCGIEMAVAEEPEMVVALIDTSNREDF